MSVCGLARCVKSDIDAVYEATKEAAKPRIHIFIATSPIHRDSKLMMTKEEVLASIKALIEANTSSLVIISFESRWMGLVAINMCILGLAASLVAS